MEALSTSNAAEEKVPGRGLKFNASEGKDDGIGIDKFLRGKVIFISGATGFVGKVLVEKILRSVPNVSKMYLMMRAKDKEAAKQRLKTEAIDFGLRIKLFKCVKQKYGKYYEAFTMSKLVPVEGNVCQSDLGLEEEIANAIKKGVQIIINSAANTSFYPSYEATLDINAMGPYHLMGFAKMCFKLELFLHLSTAYVNVPRPGRIMEQKLCMTNSMGRESLFSKSPGRFLPTLVLENENKLAAECKKTFANNAVAKKSKELGLQR
ncbi:Fatty acyl-coenzyme A reductase [Theobroma cacao]|nr:Fatty acyl-coenzyme A reductase [Theobroma cacao]